MLRTIVLGFVVWFLVLILVRLLGAAVFSAGNSWLIVFYIATFPLGVAFTYIVQAILSVPMHEMLKPMVILAIIAIMMDGFSFAFTSFYGTGEHELYAAAYLLWAPGVFLLCTYYLVSRAEAALATT